MKEKEARLLEGPVYFSYKILYINIFLLVFVRLLQRPVQCKSSDVTFRWYNVRCLDFESKPRVYVLSICAYNIDPSGTQRWIVTRSPDTCTHLLSIRFLVMCMVYTRYCGTNKIEHGLTACTVDDPLAKARGLSLRTCKQTKLYLPYNIIISVSLRWINVDTRLP